MCSAAEVRLLLADPANQLLVLDEPTNDLDLRSVDELVSALDFYRGGIVVSHDDAFLSRLDIDTWITLDENGLALEPRPETRKEELASVEQQRLDPAGTGRRAVADHLQ